MKRYTLVFQTDIGSLTLESEDGISVCGLRFGALGVDDGDVPEVLLRARVEVEEYLAGHRRAFDVPLQIRETPFQLRVWEVLRAIPYGEIRTYGQIAAAVGNPKGCRAVGMANRRNPLPIFIPCHRVIGANGQLTGFAGGAKRLDIKGELLRIERR